MTDKRIDTEVLIIGGGPAGALLGYLLARQGRRVVVVEREKTAERSFRGETIAARSVKTLRGLGFGAALDAHGFMPLTGISLREGGKSLVSVDYGRFPIGALPIDIPQPALLGAFFAAAQEFSSFQLLRGVRFAELIERDGQVVGAVLEPGNQERIEVSARLVVGADGRFSRVRKASGLPVVIEPMERDFLWFKLKRPDGWGHDAQLVVEKDKHLVILPTFPDMLRVGYNLPKRGLAELRKEGLPAFKAGIIALDPRLKELVEQEIQGWEDTSFLEIFTAEMEEWARDGLILIGDAAHTATPILGQGVNLAIQDAVFLAPVIDGFFAHDASGVVMPRSAFAEFVAKRRKHKALVTRFQRLQEQSLSEFKPLKTFLRRARFRALDLFPLKYRLLDRVLNAPHERDPELRHAAGF